jgi:hypothetical protein
MCDGVHAWEASQERAIIRESGHKTVSLGQWDSNRERAIHEREQGEDRETTSGAQTPQT